MRNFARKSKVKTAGVVFHKKMNFRSICSPKTAAWASVASVRMASRPSPSMASSARNNSSRTRGRPERRRPRCDRRNHVAAVLTECQPSNSTCKRLHRVRAQRVSQRTGIINRIRAFLLQRGVAIRRGPRFLSRGSSFVKSGSGAAASLVYAGIPILQRVMNGLLCCSVGLGTA